MTTKAQLEQYVKNDPYHIVVIYADWCGHCQDMKEKLGDKFQQYNHLTFLESENLADELLDHFPHVHIYENGVRRDGRLRDVYNLIEGK